MAYVPVIIAAVGVVIEGVSCAITGIQSTKKTGSRKSLLLGASALVGFGTILYIIAFLLYVRWHAKRKFSKKSGGLIKSRGAGWAFVIVLILTISCMGTGALLAFLESRQEENVAEANSMKAAALLVPIGALVLFIGLAWFKKMVLKNT